MEYKSIKQIREVALEFDYITIDLVEAGIRLGAEAERRAIKRKVDATTNWVEIELFIRNRSRRTKAKPGGLGKQKAVKKKP